VGRGEFDLAQRLDEDLLRVSGCRNDPAGLALGYFSTGRNLMSIGRFALSRSHFEQVLARCDLVPRRSLPFHRVGVEGFLALSLFCLGFPDQALAQSDAAIAEARRSAHAPTFAVSLSNGARLLSLLAEPEALHELADQLVVLATEQGFPFWRAQGTIYGGWVLVKKGDTVEGMSLLRSGLAAYRATGAEQWMPHYTALLASVCEAAGQVEQALALVDDALQIAERTREGWFAAELNRNKGQLVLRQGHSEIAEELYRKALGIAREQEAKLWELRAAVSLARLRRDQGRRTEARDLLVPVYGWFTEGFDTPDLKEAKALLDELR
jgi:predicted ATPase